MEDQIFGFTDIEDSTQKWEQFPQLMSQILVRHDAILCDSLERWGGILIKHTGDGIFFKFESNNCLHFALEVQRRFEQEEWGRVGPIRIRIAFNAGQAIEREGDYFGAAVNRAARLLRIATGGQILFTQGTLQFCTIPIHAFTLDLGHHLFKGISKPLPIFALQHAHLSPYTYRGSITFGLKTLITKSVNGLIHLLVKATSYLLIRQTMFLPYQDIKM